MICSQLNVYFYSFVREDEFLWFVENILVFFEMSKVLDNFAGLLGTLWMMESLYAAFFFFNFVKLDFEIKSRKNKNLLQKIFRNSLFYKNYIELWFSMLYKS